MRIPESCAECLYSRQKNRRPDPAYLAEVKRLIEERGENDTSPMLVHRFNQVYRERFGQPDSYGPIKKKYNDIVLSMEEAVRSRIDAAPDPLAAALAFARIGNYIDFGAMDTVDEKTFLSLFEGAVLRKDELPVYRRFLSACEKGSDLLLIADNCGEIVLDRLFLEQAKRRFPRLRLRVMVRGGEVLNDATVEDAVYAGVDRVAGIIPSGAAAAGTVYELLSREAREALDGADVILAKGQGNYESLSGEGRHVFFVFLCKCALFTSRFGVPPLTGILTEENGGDVSN